MNDIDYEQMLMGDPSAMEDADTKTVGDRMDTAIVTLCILILIALPVILS